MHLVKDVMFDAELGALYIRVRGGEAEETLQLAENASSAPKSDTGIARATSMMAVSSFCSRSFLNSSTPSTEEY